MRVSFAACVAMTLAAPALGWEAGMEGAICTLSHSEDGVEVRLTHDPAVPLYTIRVVGAAPWPEVPVFGIAFVGGDEITISTDRHALSEDGRALSVADRGFGNVLAGLSRNLGAVFVAGDVALSVSLEGAAPEVAAFEACGTVPSV